MKRDWIFAHLPLLGMMLVLFSTATYVYVGPDITLGQDTVSYSKGGDVLVLKNFSLEDYLEHFREANFKRKYMTLAFILIVGMCKALLGQHWYVGILILNILSICVSGYLIFLLIEAATGSVPAVFGAVLLSLVSSDFLIRSRLILSDATYMFFAFCVYVLAAFAVPSGNSANRQIIYMACAIALTGLLFFYRPVTVVVLAFLILSLAEFVVHAVFRDRGLAWVFSISLIVLGLSSMTLVLVFSAVMKDPSLWPFGSFSDNMEMMSKMYKAGITVHGRPVFLKIPETYLNNVVTYSDYLILVLKKIGFFFQISVSSFSLPHKILKYLFYGPSYLLSLVALIFLFRRGSGFSEKAKWTGWLAFQWIYLFAFYHSLMWIDYTWRYRLPCVPALIVLASLGFYQVWERFLKRMYEGVRPVGLEKST